MVRRGRDARNDRDLERLAFLERLTRHGPSAGAGRALAGPVARFARFRRVADLLLALALGVGVCGMGAMAGQIIQTVRGAAGPAEGMGRMAAAAGLTAAGYGLLKGLGELLLLWSDVAELIHSAVADTSDAPGDRPRGS